MIHPDFHPEDFDLGEPLWRLFLSDEAATRELGAWLGARLKAGDFLGLIGTLGAGKTTLVQGLIEGVSHDADIIATSPTYTLINHYETSPPIAHMDLYRLEHFDDLESIGYWDVVERGRDIACVEWFSIIPDSWPEQGVVLQLASSGEGREATCWCKDDERLPEAERQSVRLARG